MKLYFVLLMKSHLQSYPCPLQINSFWNLHLMRLVFWNSIHLDVASFPFCFLINSSWLLVFIIEIQFLFEFTFNLYCWKVIHFSQNINSILITILFLIIFSFHFWFRDLLRELDKKYEMLLTLLFIFGFIFYFSEALLFVSFLEDVQR